jgi:hypothetical protein
MCFATGYLPILSLGVSSLCAACTVEALPIFSGSEERLANKLFLRDVWIQTPRAPVASRPSPYISLYTLLTAACQVGTLLQHQTKR